MSDVIKVFVPRTVAAPRGALWAAAAAVWIARVSFARRRRPAADLRAAALRHPALNETRT